MPKHRVATRSNQISWVRHAAIAMIAVIARAIQNDRPIFIPVPMSDPAEPRNRRQARVGY